MAKRKRLDVTQEPISVDLETKSAFNTPRARMPIADVAGDAAGRGALEEIAREMTQAEAEGRVVKKLPLDKIQMHHLSRDRIALDEAEMEVLKASLKARGQQTPVEVMALSDETFGLISGLRRVEALRSLGQDSVLALVRRPEGSQAAYQAMVEENEIRAGLSFYERANVAVVAVEQGVYGDVRAAVAGLFAHAAPAKRSKIIKFVTLREELGPVLKFPAAIPEKLGLALAQALEADRKLAGRISGALQKALIEDAAKERSVLERALQKQKPKSPSVDTQREALAPGLECQAKPGRVVLTGSSLDADFVIALQNWIKSEFRTRK